MTVLKMFGELAHFLNHLQVRSQWFLTSALFVGNLSIRTIIAGLVPNMVMINILWEVLFKALTVLNLSELGYLQTVLCSFSCLSIWFMFTVMPRRGQTMTVAEKLRQLKRSGKLWSVRLETLKTKCAHWHVFVEVGHQTYLPDIVAQVYRCNCTLRIELSTWISRDISVTQWWQIFAMFGIHGGLAPPPSFAFFPKGFCWNLWSDTGWNRHTRCNRYTFSWPIETMKPVRTVYSENKIHEH